MIHTMLSILILLLSWSSVLGQRTPTISYVTPNISTTRSSTIDMDCSVLWATEYPILWMKIDEDGKPIPLASGSSLIIRDHRYIIILAKTYTTTVTTDSTFDLDNILSSTGPGPLKQSSLESQAKEDQH